MDRATIVEWTEAHVQLKPGTYRDVKYRVYREGTRNFLEMSSLEDEPIHVLQLPEGMKLDPSSYEVLLRYILLDVVAA
jgi:hypothetical protein